MMPGIGFTEMILLVVVSIVVIGPKDLPLMMRKFGKFTGKMRALAFEFKQGFDELGRQAELDELRKEVEELKKSTGVADLQRDLEQDQVNLQSDIDRAMQPASLPTPEASATTPGAAPGTPNGAQPEPTPASAGSAEAKPIPNYAGLSADHPGYDTGEEPLPEPATPHPEQARSAVSKDAAAEPAKQDTPA
jgi:sec-independent protein translocase protein TatB